MEKLKFIAQKVYDGYVRGNFPKPWEVEVKVNGEPIDFDKDLNKLDEECLKQAVILQVIGRHIYNGASSCEDIDSDYGKLSYILTIN